MDLTVTAPRTRIQPHAPVGRTARHAAWNDSARCVDVAVVGIGYAGLPLAVAAAAAGHRTRGLDLNDRLVVEVNSLRPPVDTVTANQLAEVAGLLDASTDPAFLRQCSTIALCVPTPVDARGIPDLGPLLAAVRTVRDHLVPGQLVIIESTTYPGTTDGVVRQLLEESGLRAGEDFSLAFSPERVDPGNQSFGFHNTPKVVGGLTTACSARAAEFYRALTPHVHVTRGTREAEAAKILENTYRQVNLALVNEFAQICHRLGVDVWDTIEAAATKPFGFTPFLPGAGVGGHCIPVDPLYLVHRAAQEGLPFRMAEQAQRINDSMPVWVAARARTLLEEHGIPLRGARVLLLGVTYKPNIADVRHSPAEPLAAELQALGAEVTYHDPYVDGFTVYGRRLPASHELSAGLAAADLTLVVQRHHAYTEAALGGASLLLEACGPVATRRTALLADDSEGGAPTHPATRDFS
ncbi:nucleotide sugar dehydrogenase [Streptomyces sp. NPDC059496]|uniref:nucleotide sugar dehydrogenase n=1 Tax=Streptomyces sp. NPDC059496 TaxID=3346851 RepID=UPI003690E59D